jgi:tetratricopeptide (TPR) repeat protein
MLRRSVPVLCFTVATVVALQSVAAQSATDLIAQADHEYAARDVPAALTHYEAALAADPKNEDALWKAARAGVDLGEYDPTPDHQMTLFKTAEMRARQAVQINPGDAEAHFTLARALGRTALSLGVRDRIKYAGEIRDQALACLKINPNHAGCLHVMGEWNAEVMRLNGFSRMVAKNFLGGKIFNDASWDEAQRYMIAAVTNDPRRVIHRLDLARIYADRGMKSQARTEFQIAIDGETIDYNDPHYKAEAKKGLQEL